MVIIKNDTGTHIWNDGEKHFADPSCDCGPGFDEKAGWFVHWSIVVGDGDTEVTVAEAGYPPDHPIWEEKE